MNLRRVFVLLALTPLLAAAQWRSVGVVEATSKSGANEVQLQSQGTMLTITVLADDLIHVRFQQSPNEAPPHSWSVVKNDWDGGSAEITESGSNVTV